MNKINVAVIGVGNFTRALVEGVAFYAKNPNTTVGLMNPFIGPYKVQDIHFVAGFDIDERKVGKSLSEAVKMEPNVPMHICEPIGSEALVYRGPTSGSVIDEMKGRFVKESTLPEANIIDILKKTDADIVVNLLPSGADEATYLYAEAALSASCSFINCIPTPLATLSKWKKRFDEKGLVLIGDDIKSQMGATMLNRLILESMKMRGIKIEKSKQENHGGNTDHFNLLYRAETKEKSKREALSSFLSEGDARPEVKFFYTNIPSGHKQVKLKIDGKIFGNTSLSISAVIEDEISINGAGVAVDAIRVAKHLMDQNRYKDADLVGAFLMKSPVIPMSDSRAFKEFQGVLSI